MAARRGAVEFGPIQSRAVFSQRDNPEIKLNGSATAAFKELIKKARVGR
jgi:hypothetical protein